MITASLEVNKSDIKHEHDRLRLPHAPESTTGWSVKIENQPAEKQHFESQSFLHLSELVRNDDMPLSGI